MHKIYHTLKCRSKVGYVFLGCRAIGKCFYHACDEAQSQEMGVAPFHLFKAEMKVMLSVLSGPQRKQCVWISQELFMGKVFYCIFASH